MRSGLIRSGRPGIGNTCWNITAEVLVGDERCYDTCHQISQQQNSVAVANDTNVLVSNEMKTQNSPHLRICVSRNFSTRTKTLLLCSSRQHQNSFCVWSEHSSALTACLLTAGLCLGWLFIVLCLLPVLLKGQFCVSVRWLKGRFEQGRWTVRLIIRPVNQPESPPTPLCGSTPTSEQQRWEHTRTHKTLAETQVSPAFMQKNKTLSCKCWARPGNSSASRWALIRHGGGSDDEEASDRNDNTIILINVIWIAPFM